MAVEVLDYQGFSKPRREGDADEAMMVHLHNMQNLVSLLAKQQDCSTSDAAISDFKKLVTLLGGSGLPRGGSGHARFRYAPATPVSRISSQVSAGKVRSSSALHDAVQTERVSDMDAQPLSSCSPSNQMDVCMRNTSVHDASPVTIDTQRGHVSGHARCRDSTAQKVCLQDSAMSALAFAQAHTNKPCQLQHELNQGAFVPKTNSSLLSSLSMDGGGGTVSSGKPVISSGRPPLPPKKRKAPEKIEDCATKCHNSVNCHCAKRRKLKTIRIKRVSTVGLNDGEIPADGYSWCIYGEKLSRESSQPRVYYKCSSVRGCPARKHVERASDDPNMLIVTYGREHLHPQIHKVLRASE